MLVPLFCKLAGLKVTLAVISPFTSYSALSFFSFPSFPWCFSYLRQLLVLSKKMQAACLINGDVSKRPQCRSFSLKLGVERYAHCTGAECEAHTLRWSTSIMREINNVHKWEVVLFWNLYAVHYMGIYFYIVVFACLNAMMPCRPYSSFLPL